MSKITEEEIKKILPLKGPSFEEVKKYLEKYNDEYIVIKCGGSILVDQNLFTNFINDISILNKLGFIPIIIHGGGKRISIKLKEFGIKSNFIDGLRVTDKKSIDIVEAVLNDFNKEITEALKKSNCDSHGMNSKEKYVLTVEQENEELGFVGSPKEVKLSTIEQTVKEKKYIFSNGSHDHIKNVTNQLGIDDLFDGAFDITDANFVPKPHLDPYKKLIEKFKLEPKQSILIEDIAHNLEQAKNLGMKTCWLENDEAFAKKDADKPYIDYKINSLPSFLQKINVLKITNQ